MMKMPKPNPEIEKPKKRMHIIPIHPKTTEKHANHVTQDAKREAEAEANICICVCVCICVCTYVAASCIYACRNRVYRHDRWSDDRKRKRREKYGGFEDGGEVLVNPSHHYEGLSVTLSVSRRRK